MLHPRPKLASLVLVVLLAACGMTEPTLLPTPNPTPAPNPTPTPSPTPTPGGGSVSGTVTAPAGTDLAGAVVGACPVVGNTPDCSSNAANGVVLNAGSSVPYTITGLTAAQYVVFAAQDADGDDEPELFGFYTTDGTSPAVVTPPATNVNITLAASSTPTQPSQPTEPTEPGGGSINGTVTAATGDDLVGGFALACEVVSQAEYDCGTPASVQVDLTAGSSVSYTISGLGAQGYVVIAGKDNDGNGEVPDVGDLYGFYTQDGQSLQLVTPGETGIDITVGLVSETSSRQKERLMAEPDLLKAFGRLLESGR